MGTAKGQVPLVVQDSQVPSRASRNFMPVAAAAETSMAAAAARADWVAAEMEANPALLPPGQPTRVAVVVDNIKTLKTSPLAPGVPVS
jgi:hypothetical protein